MLAVRLECTGGWKQRTCSTGRLSASHGFKYLFKTAKIWLLRIWNLRTRSTIRFSGCNSTATTQHTEKWDINSIFRVTHDSVAHFVLLVAAVDAQHVVTEVERLEATLLTEKHDERATRPVQTLSKQLPATTPNTQCIHITKHSSHVLLEEG